jgi:hypothetical protein
MRSSRRCAHRCATGGRFTSAADRSLPPQRPSLSIVPFSRRRRAGWCGRNPIRHGTVRNRFGAAWWAVRAQRVVGAALAPLRCAAAWCLAPLRRCCALSAALRVDDRDVRVGGAERCRARAGQAATVPPQRGRAHACLSHAKPHCGHSRATSAAPGRAGDDCTVARTDFGVAGVSKAVSAAAARVRCAPRVGARRALAVPRRAVTADLIRKRPILSGNGRSGRYRICAVKRRSDPSRSSTTGTAE